MQPINRKPEPGITESEVVSQADDDGTTPEQPVEWTDDEGSQTALADGSQSVGFPIKGNRDSMLYHVPGSAFYQQTVAEVWFATPEAAEDAGFRLPPSQRSSTTSDPILPAPDTSAAAAAATNDDAITQSRARSWNERFAQWKDRFGRRWSIPTFLVVVVVALFGIAADKQANDTWLPCFFKDEQVIKEPYGIVVGNIAVRRNHDEELSAEEEDNAEKSNEALFNQVNGELSHAGSVGVSHTCNTDIQTPNGREKYLSETRDKLSGDLAISVILTLDGSRVATEVELSIGSREHLNEAQELDGYYTFLAGTIGAPLGVRDSIFASAVAERISPYLVLLRAVSAYVGSGYTSVIELLTPLVENSGVAPPLRQLAYVLIGNAEGRMESPGSLDRAEAAYLRSLNISSSYPRAILGLAEIDYQKALAQVKAREGSRCEGTLTPQSAELLNLAYAKYVEVHAQANGPSLPDIDARASYGMGRVQACLFRLGDVSRAKLALRDLQFVTDRFESDTRKSWLQSPASGAYGELGLVYCGLGQRDKALANYTNALEWAVDNTRAEQYRVALTRIQETSIACT